MDIDGPHLPKHAPTPLSCNYSFIAALAVSPLRSVASSTVVGLGIVGTTMEEMHSSTESFCVKGVRVRSSPIRHIEYMYCMLVIALLVTW